MRSFLALFLRRPEPSPLAVARADVKRAREALADADERQDSRDYGTALMVLSEARHRELAAEVGGVKSATIMRPPGSNPRSGGRTPKSARTTGLPEDLR